METQKKILVVGASGDIGFQLLNELSSQDVVLGAHYCCHKGVLESFIKNLGKDIKIKAFKSDISSQKAAQKLVCSFVSWAGGIDALVQLSGGVSKAVDWLSLNQSQWEQDIAVNLTGPFFLAQEALKHMRKQKSGKIVLTSTASASHGGGRTSMAYGAAKAGIECITKGLAREGAKDNILVNCIAPGFIQSKFHTVQMKRKAKDLAARAQMVPLKRAGHPSDVTQMIQYLLSDKGNYITGQVMVISGGDWL